MPSRIEELEPKTKTKAGRLRVYWEETQENGEKVEVSDEFNTVSANNTCFFFARFMLKCEITSHL